MASTYSPLLRLELIGTGEQAGTWGDTTNTNLGTLIEQAIAGTATFSVTSADVTLSDLDGASDQARCAVLNVTGAAGVTRNIVAPATSKLYLVRNGADADVVIKTSTSTGYTVPVGANSWVVFDGSDFIAAAPAIKDNGDVIIPKDIYFTGTNGSYIYGDFSGATTAQRLVFKTTETNDNTGLRVMPNGTATIANIGFASSSADLANTALCAVGIDGTVSQVASYGIGTGVGLPLVFGAQTGLGLFERMRITTDGEVMIAGTTDQGAYNLQVNGTGVWAGGAYVNGSDAKLKDNVEALDSCLDVVKAMRPVTYKYKASYSKDQNTQTGFIAQELQAAMAGKDYLNGIVQAGPRYLNVAYQNIIPLLTKAIQEQQEQIEQLKAEVAAIKGA